MSKVSIMMVAAVAGLAGVASAQKAGGSGAGSAPKADAKAGSAAGGDMYTRKAPAEIAEMAKQMAGTWRCEGTGMMGATELKFKGTMKSKADLDGFWVHDSFDGTMGEGKAAMKFKFEGFSTFDPGTKKWRTVMVDNWGGEMVGTSDGMVGGKMDTTSDTMDMRGKGQFKDHTDATDPKKGIHMWGEESRDGGKSWNKVYDMTCKK